MITHIEEWNTLDLDVAIFEAEQTILHCGASAVGIEPCLSFWKSLAIWEEE